MDAAPRNPRDAISACQRALAGAAHRARDDHEALTQRLAATNELGIQRVISDRWALAQRWHHAPLHHQHRPAGDSLAASLAAQLYDQLEQLRLDTLGAHWLRGIRRNLDDDGWSSPNVIGQAVLATRWRSLQWAWYLQWRPATAQPAPQRPSEHVDIHDWQATLALCAEAAPMLALLHAEQARPETYAATAATVARWLAARCLNANHADANAATLTTDPTDLTDLADAANRDAASADPSERQTAAQSAQQPAKPAPPRPNTPQPNPTPLPQRAAAVGAPAHTDPGAQVPADYRVFDRSDDAVSEARMLAAPGSLLALREQFERQFGSTRTLALTLARRLRRKLQAEQQRDWRFDQETGRLDATRLAPWVAQPLQVRPFKQEGASRFPASCVGILIDLSGSMKGRSILMAALVLDVLIQALEPCGIACEALGFTTRSWHGGEPATRWREYGAPPQPGRLNALQHVVLKAAAQPWRRARSGLGLVLQSEFLKENIDGEALQWAAQRLLARPEPRRLLLVISDGAPRDEATLAANDRDYLDRHLREVIRQLESPAPAQPALQLAAIGIGHDVSRYYRYAVTLATVESLAPSLAKLLTEQLTQHARPR